MLSRALSKIERRLQDLPERAARARRGPSGPPPTLEALEELDRGLARAGIHTAADARLLGRLARGSGRLPAVAVGLRGRALAALAAFEAHLRRLERTPPSRWPAGARTALPIQRGQLERVLKTADLLAAPDVALRWPIRPREGAPSVERSPRLAAAEFFLNRAAGALEDLDVRRRDVARADALLRRAGLSDDPGHAHALRLRAARERALAEEQPAGTGTAQIPYAALRARYLRAVDAGSEPLAIALRSALDVFPGRPPAAPVPAADDLLAELVLGAGEAGRGLLEIARGIPALVPFAEGPIWAAARRAAPRDLAPDRVEAFEITGELAHLARFVIDDPRVLLPDLAAGRQRVRALEPGRARVRGRATRVRLYLCDASGSMRGARARFRDALLLAELDALRRRALQGAPIDPLYLGFFDDKPSRLERIDTAEAAREWMARLVRGGPAQGLTQISVALRSAAEALRAARRSDPDLARASVILVTDGEDRLEEGFPAGEWSRLLGVSVSWNVVTLGEPNPHLVALVEQQRARGGEAFWFHLPDAALATAPGDFDVRPATLLPEVEDVSAVDLAALAPHLEALEALARGEVLVRPVVTVAQFDALFPEPPEGAGPAGDGAEDVDLLEVIAEVAALAPLEHRPAEAVDLLQHLLLARGQDVAGRSEAWERPGPRGRAALRRIRLLCRPFETTEGARETLSW